MACVGCTDRINCLGWPLRSNFPAIRRRAEQNRKPTPLHTMISLRTALLATFLLAVSYRYATARPDTPKECCFDYVTGPIQFTKLVDFYRTSSDCHLQAVVLETHADRKVCADPSKLWVKRAISRLEAKKEQKSQSAHRR
ncbi:C-C motif chemokine 17-like [Pelodiscus sinensis]|uniref:C-C motif chemokine 17-like n=1 Tax=Pelodiscus sinensis TaxID=13735 RepID=UPI003F6D7219